MKDRLEKMIAHMRDIEILEDELQAQQAEAVARSRNPPSKNPFYFMAQGLLDNGKQNAIIFGDQIDIIRKISPPAADELYSILDEYKNVQVIVEKEFKKEFKKNKDKMSHELVQRIDGKVNQMARYYDRLHDDIAYAYNCFAGVINFISAANDTPRTKKTARRKPKNTQI